jgi:hypothetical protein
MSPGGNPIEGMKIGEILRSHYFSVRATTSFPQSAPPELALFLPYRVDEQPPKCEAGGSICCASACALAYFGGARWFRFDRLGMHRPTLQDLSDYTYSESSSVLKETMLKIKEYMQKMEVDDRFLSSNGGDRTRRNLCRCR